MNHRNFIIAILNFFVLSVSMSCSNKSDKGSTDSEIELTEEEIAAGFQLLESSCFSCHSPNAAMDNRIAPPMAAVKKHYVKDETSYEDFRADLVAFVNDPSEENAQMPRAIRKFGVMPKMSFDSTQHEQMAYYIFHNELEAPEWFEQHYQQERKRHGRQMGNKGFSSNQEYMKHGKQIAMNTKSVLGGNLKRAINTDGAASAIDFCNTRAIPLTDSMSVELNASVRRVSDKPRNPNNRAKGPELAYIQATKALITSGEQPKPQLQEIDGRMVGYYPIVTNGMCLQCHGVPKEQILDETVAAINAKYPADEATGYGENELRGIWAIGMDKQGGE